MNLSLVSNDLYLIRIVRIVEIFLFFKVFVYDVCISMFLFLSNNE